MVLFYITAQQEGGWKVACPVLRKEGVVTAEEGYAVLGHVISDLVKEARFIEDDKEGAK